MTGTITKRDLTGSSANANGYASASFTPTAGEYLVVVAWGTGTLDTAPTCAGSANSMTFTRVENDNHTLAGNDSCAFISDQAVPASPAAMTVTVTFPTDAGTGCFVATAGVTGLNAGGASGARQLAITANIAANGAYTGTFASATLTTNPILGFVGHAGGAQATAPGISPPSGFTEIDEPVDQTLPGSGFEWCKVDSGQTATSYTFTSSVARTRANVIFIEFDTTSAAAPALPPAPARRATRPAPPRRRGRAEVVASQVVVAPPSKAPDTGRHAARLLSPRRRRPAEVVPLQIVATPPTLVPDARRRTARGFVTRRRRPAEVVPLQIVATPPAYVPDARRRAARILSPRRGRAVAVTLLQAVVPESRRRAARGFVARRRSRVEVIPPQLAPPAAPDPRRRRGFVARRRGRVEVVPPQIVVAPPAYVVETRRRLARGFVTRRRRPVEVTPPQVVVAPPAYVPTASAKHALRGVPRRGRRAEVVPAQQAAPVAPAYVSTMPPKHALRGMSRRRRAALVPPAQAQPPAHRGQPRRLRGLARRVVRAVGIFGISTATPDTSGTAGLYDPIGQTAELATASGPGYIATSPGSYVSAPDDARLDVTGDLDIAVLIAPDDWHQLGTQGVLSKGNAYNLILTDASQFRLEWKDSGGSFHSAYLATGGDALNAQLVAGQFRWIRMTLDVDNGAGGRTISLYYSLSAAIVPTWTLFDTVTQGGVTDVNNSTDPITVGTHGGEPFTGKIAYAEVRSGLAGAIVAAPDWRVATTGPGQTDIAGSVWAAVGSPTFEEGLSRATAWGTAASASRATAGPSAANQSTTGQAAGYYPTQGPTAGRS